jgi:hypothetical protein
MQSASLGVILGGLLVFYWNAMKAENEEGDDEDGDGDSKKS